MTAIDFHCHQCGKETALAPDPPDKAVCEDCCEDHDYRYDRWERTHVCTHCGKPVDHEWYSD